MAARIGRDLQYRGWLQADFIEDAEGRLWLLEINPRWSAGMEVLHVCRRSNANSPLAQHLEAVGFSSAPFLTDVATDEAIDEDTDGRSSAVASTDYRPRLLAKAILYAPVDVLITRDKLIALYEHRSSLKTLIASCSGPTGSQRLGNDWSIADIPRCACLQGTSFDGTTFQAGEPILTLRVTRPDPTREAGGLNDQSRQELLAELTALRTALLRTFFTTG
jgi:hypothetical protein